MQVHELDLEHFINTTYIIPFQAVCLSPAWCGRCLPYMYLRENLTLNKLAQQKLVNSFVFSPRFFVLFEVKFSEKLPEKSAFQPWKTISSTSSTKLLWEWAPPCGSPLVALRFRPLSQEGKKHKGKCHGGTCRLQTPFLMSLWESKGYPPQCQPPTALIRP